jgi:hypothetical protein
MPASRPKRFRATLERMNSNLGWVIIRIPFDVKKTWGGSRIKVQGQVNGASFRTSLFPQRDGGHFLLVNKQVQRTAHIGPGSTAEFHLEPDTTPRIAEVPGELERIFKQSKRLKTWFEQLNYSYRREIGRWISQPKNADSRRRRAEQIAERIMETIEAERELPPLIAAALAGNALARQGWKRMTPIQQRLQLFAIFGYRSPESRQKRLQKVMEMAAALGDRS